MLDRLEDAAADLPYWTWLEAVAILLAAVVLAAIARRVVQRSTRAGNAPPGLATFLGKLAAVLVVSAGAVYALGALGVRIGPLLGALGVGGVALAFALSEVFENFIAGVFLQMRQPVRVGDEVTIGGTDGVVEEVDFRVVRLRGFDGTVHYVPNRNAITETIENHTVSGARRTELEVGVAYGTDLRDAVARVERAVAAVDGVDPEHPLQVFLHEFGADSINMTVRFWHQPRNRVTWELRHEAVLAVEAALAEAGIEIPFPQRTLSAAGPIPVRVAGAE